MAITIDELQIQIEAEAKKSTKGLDTLAASLRKLEASVGNLSGVSSNLSNLAQALKSLNSIGKINLTSPINQLTKLKETMGSMQTTTIAVELKQISTALSSLSGVPKVGLTSIANGIKALNEATASMNNERLTEFNLQMRGVAQALSNLSGIGKSGIGSMVNALKQIPEINTKLDDKTIARFSTAMRSLSEALAPLAERMEKVGQGFSTFRRSADQAIKQTNKITTANKKASTSYENMFLSLSRITAKYLALYYSMRKIVDVFAEAFNTSNEYIESLNLFRVSMGETADAAQEFAEKVGDVMGIDPAEWMQNQGVFQRMMTGFGITSDQANIMSQNLTQLAYDMASFFNTDVETAMQKLQSGMSGQIKGLKAWGYNLSVAALQETALSLGIEQSVRTMTEAQKAQLRYITLIQKSNGVMGDMAKTINTPANSMRILSAQVTQLKRAFGDITSVLVTKFIPYIQAFVELLTEAAKALATLMGFEIAELPSNNLEMGSEVIDGIGDSAEDANEAVEDLKRQLAGFDELNILSSDDKNTELSYDLGFEMPEYDFIGEAFSSYTDIVDDFKGTIVELKSIFDTLDFTDITERLRTLFSTLKSQFEGLDFKTPLREALTEALDYMVGIANAIVQVVSPIIESLNIPRITLDSTILLGKLFKTFDDVIDSLTPALTAFAKSLTPIIEWIGGALSQAFAVAIEMVSKLGDLFKELEPAFTRIGEKLGEIVVSIWEFLEPLASSLWEGALNILSSVWNVILSLTEVVVNLADVVLGDLSKGFEGLTEILAPLAEFLETALSDAFNLLASVLGVLSSDILPEVADTFGNLWNKVLVPLVTFIGSVLSPIIKILSDVLTKLWQGVVLPLSNSLGGVFMEAFNSVSTVLNNTFIPMISDAIEVLQFLWDYVLAPICNFLYDVFEPVVAEVFNALGEDVERIMGIFKGLIQFITSVFSGDWSGAWQSIKDIFSGIWEGLCNSIKFPINAVLALFEGLANKVVDAWNWIKRSINSISIDVPEWLGGGTIGFDLKMSDHISIPRFASGGFPTMGEMFIARERGPELVGRIGNKNAVANNNQITAGIASAVYSAMMAAKEDGDNGGSSARIVVQIGETPIGEAAVRFINGQIVQTGVSPIYS